MEPKGSYNLYNVKSGTDSMDSDDLIPPGTSPTDPFLNKPEPPPKVLKPTPKGVENAKKRLRAFSIQKKTSLSPVSIPKPINTGTTTVLIGKLGNVKPSIKPVEDATGEQKKPPKPPKPGAHRQHNDSYIELQKRTLSEIETMKRKMELVELGIPLGLICPAPNSDQAMPTKAMPPIKTLLDPDKVDEIIREAKKAKAEGKEFKFDYKNLLPEYDNPFQRKKEEETKKREDDYHTPRPRDKFIDKYNPRTSRDKYDRRYSHKPPEKYREKDRSKEKIKDRDEKALEIEKIDEKKSKVNEKEASIKEAEVDLKDYLVCDSWSLEDVKAKVDSPKIDKKKELTHDPIERIKHNLKETSKSPVNKPKIERLQPVIDSFKYEIEDDDIIDMFDENSPLENFEKATRKSDNYSPTYNSIDIDTSIDIGDDTFLEEVINEIKHDSLDETSDDKGLVEYDVSPQERQSVTPELNTRLSLSRSDISDGYKSVESSKSDGYKSGESGYKSTESGYKSKERKSERDYKSEKDYKSSEKDYKSQEKDYKSLEREYKSKESSYKSEKDYKSSGKNYKSSERDFESSERDYKPSERVKSSEKDYKSLERDSKSSKSDYKRSERVKLTEKGYESSERDYKSTEMEYKSKESSYKSDSDYKSSERDYKSSERDYKSSEGDYKSERDYKSPERDYKSEKDYKSSEKDYKSSETRQSTSDSIDEGYDLDKMSKATVESLEMWNFVLKICQPLLFRHDKNRCYKETRTLPKIWYTENPKLCDCVKDRQVVYEELEMCKMDLVDRVYACDQEAVSPPPPPRSWWAAQGSAPPTNNPRDTPPHACTGPEMSLDKEYQRFMEAVWPEVESKSETPRSTPVREVVKKNDEEPEDGKKEKKVKHSEGWSQESDVEEDTVKSKKKVSKEKRKRKDSSSSSDSDSEVERKKKKKSVKKKDSKKSKEKSSKRRRLSKKYLKKLKDKKNKKLVELEENSESDDDSEKKKKSKKEKKKKQQKLKKKKKNAKKKSRRRSTSSSSSSSSDSDTDESIKKNKKKRKRSTSESQEFDVNILKNIKTERLTDDEKRIEFSPRKKPREIIDVKQLQNDFVGNNQIQIKKEVLKPDEQVIEKHENKKDDIVISDVTTEKVAETVIQDNKATEIENKVSDGKAENKVSEVKNVDKIKLSLAEIQLPENRQESKTVGIDIAEIKLPEKKIDEMKHAEKVEKNQMEINLSEIKLPENKAVVEKAESKIPEKKQIRVFDKVIENFYEQDSQSGGIEGRDRIHMDVKETQDLTPTLQTKPLPEESSSQCSSQDSTISKIYQKDDSHLRPSSQNSNYSFQDIIQHQNDLYSKDIETTEHMNYEMYEQMAIEYQSDVATQCISPAGGAGRRIETVVRARTRGEIKCDWRAGDSAPQPECRTSRWGLKPSEVNIVLTGGSDQFPTQEVNEPAVYKIQSIANRTDNSNTGYDEAYMDTYGASDRLTYGDCFASRDDSPATRDATRHSSLDDRIDLALRTTVLGDVAKDEESKDDKGILVTKPEGRGVKRVSFADGYKPGQDSDVEEPPVKKKKKRVRRFGCAWPCPATHPDHVPLWDCLPPPRPPPGSPPPPPQRTAPLTAQLLRGQRRNDMLVPPPLQNNKFDPNCIPFMPPEPPPGMISF